jgi:hypothetical protein
MSPRHIAPGLLLVAIAVIYLWFPTRVYYWDGIAFAQAIEDAPRLTASLVHPNHVIYNFAGYGFYKLLRSLGFDLRAVTALQILNSLLSTACAGVLFVILRDTLRSLYLAISLTALFAFSATWWKFSTDANAYIPSVLFILITFYLLLPGRRFGPLLPAVTFFISMAFHQLAVVMFPPLALGVYLQDGPTSIKRRALNVVLFSVTSAVLILASYWYLFSLAAPAPDIYRFIRWTTSFSPDAETAFSFWSNLRYSLRGQVRLFFGGRFNLLRGIVNPFIIILIVALAGAVMFVIFGVLSRGRSFRGLKERHLETRQKTVFLLALVWAAVYLVFLFFWLPQNTFYRLFYLPALILLLGLGLSSLRKAGSAPRRYTAVFVAAVALANFLFLIYPFSHVEKYPPLTFALQMNREWPSGTVVYYGAVNSDAGLVQYFTPSTQWRLLHPKYIENLNLELAEIYSRGGTAWFETTAIDNFSSTPDGARWLETHTRKDSLKELDDGAYRIRFIQVVPGDQSAKISVSPRLIFLNSGYAQP